MVTKVLFNIFLNIALITLAASFYWSFAHGYYPMSGFVVVIFGMFVYFKVLLAKSVKEAIRKKEKENSKPAAKIKKKK